MTSGATGAVSAAPVPLTVSLTSAAPASHDGLATVTYKLRFGEEPEPDFSYEALKFHAFEVTAGPS